MQVITRKYAYSIGIDEAGRAARKGESSPRFAGEAGRPVRYYIGIDEAGRGPLAGPVVVGGVKMKRGMGRLLSGIKDSKKLSAKQREEWFAKLTVHPNIAWAVARVYPKTIDRINIARATNLGVRRVYQKLSDAKSTPALLDGSLYLPSYIPYKTIIRGDEKIPIISAASIIAKVTRDRIMTRLHKKYPEYRFDIHKGYGTKLHRAMIKKHGRSEVHRKSFQTS
ncbi:MAG: ribonuclease HII [bacterium]|nr:ribonuclease HII [bacterium]